MSLAPDGGWGIRAKTGHGRTCADAVLESRGQVVAARITWSAVAHPIRQSKQIVLAHPAGQGVSQLP
jgi:hypothetical protein